MAKPIIREQTSTLLTKEKYLFYYKLDLYFNHFYFDDLILYFDFWISTVNRFRKIGTTTATWPQICFFKNRRLTHFLNLKPQITISVSRWPHFKI